MWLKHRVCLELYHVLLYTNGSDRSFIGMRTSEILSNHTCAVHGLFPSCKHTCYVSQLEKWSVIDFYWFAATGFGIILLYFQTVVIPAFQGCFFFFLSRAFQGCCHCWMLAFSISGLILGPGTTQHNWTFGLEHLVLKSLSHAPSWGILSLF